MKKMIKDLLRSFIDCVKRDYKDVTKRAVKTFAQAFLAYLTANTFVVTGDEETVRLAIKSLLVGGLAAGISALWNTIVPTVNGWIDYVFSDDEYEEEEDEDGNNSET